MDPASYRISEKAVARVAEIAVLSVPGVREIDAKLAGLAGRSFPRIDAQIDRPGGSVILDLEIVNSYPAPIGAITDEVRQTVSNHVTTLTGLSVTKVNVNVVDAESTAFGERVTRNDLKLHPTEIAAAPVRVTRSQVTSPHVKEPIELADIEVDDSTYKQIASIEAPEPQQIRSISAPLPSRPRSVEMPEPPRVDSVETPEPFQPTLPQCPEQTPLRAISVNTFGSANGAHPRSVSPPAPAPLRDINIKQYAPRIPVERPAQRPLQYIQVARAAQLTPVSLPAQKPLREIRVNRLRYVGVDKPMPAPLRAISVPQLDVVKPQVPQQRPLKPITIETEEEA